MRRFPFLAAALGLALLLSTPALPAPASPADAEADLKAIVRAARHPDLRWPAITDVRSEIERLYARNEWRALWLDGARPTEAAIQLVARLVAADTLGLEPPDYDARWLERVTGEFKLTGTNPTAQERARYDVGLSVAAARFVSALACGRVDPKTLDPAYDIPRHCPPVDTTVAELRDGARQGAVLAAIQPPFHHYQLLKNGLARYRAMVRDTELVGLPPITPDTRPGQLLRAAPELRRLLRATGDLAQARDPKVERDTFYTPELVEAVQRYQGRQGFLPDGVLWSQTIEQLDRPLNERVRQIELTLERWRWLPNTYEIPPLIVNIPAFQLYAFNGLPGRSESMLTMDVLVGAAVWNETTVFSAPMTHVIFRPYWEVPASIAQFEMGPRAVEEREAMERRGYVLVRAGGADNTALPLTPENLARVGKGLRLRQRPGALNALGLIKFMLPNPHDIYLHDTPAPGLFILPRRDFSHGCIRVSDPVALAVHVMRGLPGWTPERVRAAMDSGEDDFRVDLAQPVPVFVVYATAAAAENGEVFFYTDIYKRDAKLDAILQKVAPFPHSGAERKGRKKR